MQTRCCKCCLLQSLLERRFQLCLGNPAGSPLGCDLQGNTKRLPWPFVEWRHIPTATRRSPAKGTPTLCGHGVLPTGIGAVFQDLKISPTLQPQRLPAEQRWIPSRLERLVGKTHRFYKLKHVTSAACWRCTWSVCYKLIVLNSDVFINL